MKSQSPYNSVRSFIFLVDLILAYQAESCSWINIGIYNSCVWIYCDSIIHNTTGMNRLMKI